MPSAVATNQLSPETVKVLVDLGIDVAWARRKLLGKRIFAVAAQYHGVAEKTMLSSATREVARMRFTAMAAMRTAQLSLNEIGNLVGIGDHSSVRYAVQTVASDARLSEQARDLYEMATGQKQREAA